MSSGWLAFSPRDSVFVRDGRSFDAVADSSARPVRPGPSTIAGAVGAALPANPLEVRGPVLARRVGGAWVPFFPPPADLVCTPPARSRYVYRLIPAKLAGSTDLGTGQAGADPPGPDRWMTVPDGADGAEPLEGLVSADALAAYLAGGLPAASGTPLADLRPEQDPLIEERRVGLARDSDRRARPGFLYQSAHWRPADGWAFLAECAFADGQEQQPSGPVQLGGRGRLADVETAEMEWPAHPAGLVGRKVAVYLATPALWPGGWRVPARSGARLVAAVAGRPQLMATVTPGPQWRQSRMMRWAVPAGSVYLLEFDDGEEGARWAAAVHGTALGPAVKEEIRTAGFGVVLTGAWS